MTTEPPADLKAWMDIEQIKALKARYFRFIDGHKWAELRSLFSDDLRMYRDDEPEPASTTADAFVARVSTNLANVLSVHHGHMPEIELTGPTTAHGVCAAAISLRTQSQSSSAFSSQARMSAAPLIEDFAFFLDQRHQGRQGLATRGHFRRRIDQNVHAARRGPEEPSNFHPPFCRSI